MRYGVPSLLALAAALIAATAAAAQSSTGSLVIVSEPAGARVYLDGTDLGEATPFGPAQLPPGSHTIELRLSGFPSQARQVTVAAGRTTRLDFRFAKAVVPPPAPKPEPEKRGALKLGSEPAGARVYLNREQRGATPLEILSLKQGSYELRLELPGYAPQTSTVDIREGETVQTLMRLQPLGGAGGVIPGTHGRTIVVLLAVLVVTGGGLAATIVAIKRRRGVVIIPTPSRGVPIADGALAFGDYRVVEKVASGGMANVYRALHRTRLDQAAVKVPYEQFQHDRAFIERFRREAELGRRLHNENIVRIYEAGTTKQGITYLAMEFIDGIDLRHAMAQGLGILDAVDVVIQLGRALDYAHSKGVIHRDIKPENIMLTKGHPRRVVLMDFGIARASFDATIGTGSTFLGTPYYMAPEPANGREPGPPSDLYSVGVLFFEMLTGRRPFEGDSPIIVLQRHVSDQAPSPRVLNPKIPARLDAVVLKLLAKKPEERYQVADQLIVELEDFLRGGRA